jgi:quinol monooxygenase YgiN
MFRQILFVAVLLIISIPALAQPVGPVVVLVKVFPSAGREGELQALYLKRLEYLRKAEPDASFKLHRTAKEPTVFLWYEVYPSQAAYDNHLKVVMINFRKDFGPTPEGILARPSESESYLAIEP